MGLIGGVAGGGADHLNFGFHHRLQRSGFRAGRIEPPLVIGHEFVGRVRAIGAGVTGIEIGQRVSAECHVACGTCNLCRTGRAHICENTRIIGVDTPGTFAETITLPATNIWHVPDAIPDHHAVIYDPIGNAMHMVTTAGVTGEDVLVVGGGPIGLFAAAIAESLGLDLVVSPRASDCTGKPGRA